VPIFMPTIVCMVRAYVRAPRTLLTQYLELDGQGKARREAARRRNFECKINFNSRNSSRSNGSRPTAVQPRRRPGTAVGLLHSELRRRAASRRALPCTSSFCLWTKVHHVAWKSLVRILSLAPKLSGLRRCILSQNF